MRSMTASQEMPVQRDTDASHSASSSSVAPRKLMALSTRIVFATSVVPITIAGPVTFGST